MNQFHLFDPQHSFRKKLWTSTYLSFESYLPTNECCCCGEFVKWRDETCFVRLLHNSLKSLLHWRCQNFWLTVQIGIADLDLVFVSLFSTGWVKRLRNSVGSIPADKVLATGFAKTFPDIPCVSQMRGGPSLRLGIPIERLSIPPGTGWGGQDSGWLVTCECPLRTDSTS